VICVPDAAKAAARDEAMAVRVGDEPAPAPDLPDLTSGFTHLRAPHAGTQFVQGADAGVRFDDAYGNGWRLVVLGADVACIGQDERAWFESIGGRVVELVDPDPLFTKWFAEHETTCALQRPDFYLYGTAADAPAATALLADLRRHLAEGSTR
jgi:flavoprotein hydroxylase